MDSRVRQALLAALLLVCVGGVVLWLLPPPAPGPSGRGEAGEASRARGAVSGEQGRDPLAEGGTAQGEGDLVPGDVPGEEREPRPGEGTDEERKDEGTGRPGGSPETFRGGSTTPGGGTVRGPPILDPAFHQEILRELPEQQTVSYLAIRVRKLASDTLRRFPDGHAEERLEVRRRVEYLHGRVSDRKRAAAADAEAFEALRRDLVRLDRSLERWRARVLAGEPAIPEIDL